MGFRYLIDLSNLLYYNENNNWYYFGLLILISDNINSILNVDY